MDNYCLILYVTIEKENAIRTLFQQRGWPFLKSDIQHLQHDDGSYAPFPSIYFTHKLRDEQTTKGLIQSKRWHLQLMENLPASEKDMKNEENSYQNGEHYIAAKVENFTINRVENVSENSEHIISYDTNDNSNGENVVNSSNFQEEIVQNQKHDDNGLGKLNLDQKDNEGYSHIRSEHIDEISAEPNDCTEEQNTVEDEITFEVKNNKHLRDGQEISSNESRMQECQADFKRKNEYSEIPFFVKKRRNDQEQVKAKNMSEAVDQSEGRKVNGYQSKKQQIHCDECDTTFTSMKRFEGHKARNGGQCVFTCEYCGKIFKYRKSKYILHVRAAHTKERPHSCDLCGKSFVTSDKLKIHKRTHTNERPCVCEQCGKSFYCRADLSIHKHYHHTAHENVDDLKCDICDVTFCSKRYLVYHKKVTHSETKDFLCSQCEKSFKSSRALNRHFKVMHTEIRDYKCKVCHQTFKTSDYLRKHMFCHTGERNYLCSYCDKAFYNRAKLIEHERIHTGVKPYQCDLCNYRCALSGNLNKHKKTQHGRQPNSLISILKSNNLKN